MPCRLRNSLRIRSVIRAIPTTVTGSVQMPMSSYLAMTGNIRNMRNASVDSAIYAQIRSDDRVGLKLFNASPETGVDYLELLPRSCGQAS